MIHTTKLGACNSLDSSVDLKEIARRSSGFSGADLTGLVDAAVLFARRPDLVAGTTSSRLLRRSTRHPGVSMRRT